MNAEDMYIGQKVLVARKEGEHVGWVSEMSDHLGKIRTIKNIIKREASGEIYHVVTLKEDIAWLWNPKSFEPAGIELNPITPEEFNALLFGGV